MATFRVSTFNCENLFSRPAVLNFDDNHDAKEPLRQLAKLDAIFAKTKYSEDDKATIFDLLEELKEFLELNEMRNKLVGKKKVGSKWVPIIKPDGRAGWVGGIVLKRDKLPTAAQQSTAKVIGAVNADVQCLVEMEDRLTLEQNDKSGNAPLAGLLGLAGLKDVVETQFPDPKDRWTYHDKSQIDYLLVSEKLAGAMTQAGIERRGLFEADKLTKNLPSGQVQPFNTVTTSTNDASDHAAVWAEFEV